MKHWMTRLATVGAATAMVGLWLPISSANAAVGALRFTTNNATSTAQAGYFQLTPPAISSVSANFTVPTIIGCTATDTAVGFGTFIFTSSSASGASVTVGCVSGTPVYEGALIVNGVEMPTSFTPAPGNVIMAKTKETASKTSVTLYDITQAAADNETASVGGTNSAILAGVDTLNGSSGQLPVPNFTKVHFTAGKIDGTTVGASGAGAYDLNATGSQVQIKTSALTGGNAWTEKFIHA